MQCSVNDMTLFAKPFSLIRNASFLVPSSKLALNLLHYPLLETKIIKKSLHCVIVDIHYTIINYIMTMFK